MALYTKRHKAKLNACFERVEQELDLHLDSINDNTNEILENRNMIQDMHERICKLTDEISSLKLKLEENKWRSKIELTLREQEVFILIYTSADPISYGKLSRKLFLPLNVVDMVISGLVMKGIPVKKKVDSDIMVYLDEEFVEEHSKNNLVEINQEVMKQFNRDFQMKLME